jgi:hypothetical protein
MADAVQEFVYQITSPNVVVQVPYSHKEEQLLLGVPFTLYGDDMRLTGLTVGLEEYA